MSPFQLPQSPALGLSSSELCVHVCVSVCVCVLGGVWDGGRVEVKFVFFFTQKCWSAPGILMANYASESFDSCIHHHKM